MTDHEAIATAVTAERRELCEALDQLSDDDWQTPLAVPRLAVHHIAAHLALATLETMRETIVGAIKARGNFDRMTRGMAIERAERFTPAELVDQIRTTATSTRRAPMSNPLDPLVDILVHSQDIARPLGRSHPMDPEHVVLALTHAVESRWYGGSKRFADVRLVSSDASWTAGGGTREVRGTAGDLLVLATGRADVLATLAGPGVADVATRPQATKATS